jgi:hypothetical protein
MERVPRKRENLWEGTIMKPLQAERLEIPGVLESIEICFDSGWTDGLPIIPPTEGRVGAFPLGRVGRAQGKRR